MNSKKLEYNDEYNCHVEINYQNLYADIRNETWNKVIIATNPDNSLDRFYDILNFYINKHSTHRYKKQKNKYKKIKPWITQGIINSIKTRDKLAKKLKKEPLNIELRNNYKKYRNKLTGIIKKIKEKYYTEKFESNKYDPKKFWETVKEATNSEINKKVLISEMQNEHGKLISNKKDIASALNTSFVILDKTYLKITIGLIIIIIIIITIKTIIVF